MEVAPKVTMSADLDVIPGRPFKGEAKAMGIQSTEDDLNLQVALDEPEQWRAPCSRSRRSLAAIRVGQRSLRRWRGPTKRSRSSTSRLADFAKAC